MTIDKSYVDKELLRRYNIHKEARNHKEQLKAVYREFPLQFIKDCAISYDPRLKTKIIPFIPFPRQIALFNWLQTKEEQQEPGLIEKSRELGATWLCCYYSLWRWLFYDSYDIGWGSRKEKLVHKIGDMGSILEKIKFAIRWLPGYLRPTTWNEKKHIRFMLIENPENGSVIKGEAGDNIGRGDRTTLYFVDEKAFIQNQESVDAALSNTTNVQIDLSSANGENAFYQKRISGNVEVFTFKWTEDPRKDQDWYNKKKRELMPHIFQSEIEINYHASVEDVLIPQKYVMAAIEYQAHEDGEKFAAYDPADGGADKNALVMGTGVKIEEIDNYRKEGEGITQSAAKVKQKLIERKIKECNFDAIGIGAHVKGLSDKKIRFVAIKYSNSPDRGLYDDTQQKNKEVFYNLKAQIFWCLRRRLEKTYEHVNNISVYPESELASLPNDTSMIAELCCMKYSVDNAGKIRIETKKELKKRGVKSPNIADAVAMFYYRARILRL